MLWWVTLYPCTHGKHGLHSVVLRRKGRGRAEEEEEEDMKLDRERGWKGYVKGWKGEIKNRSDFIVYMYEMIKNFELRF